ncbi:TRAM domain-containing protein [Neglectibacter timonensis]
MTAEGFGVGRIHGIAVFVPLTAPGDIAEIRIVKTESVLPTAGWKS